ncbi:MAG: tetratricopeptide repeat protein [Balneolaceae bacterium]|nr:tetratricopeptide repeat protein [Balneolaceae bacterium]
MSEDPEHRFESAGELLKEIERWLDGRPVACYSSYKGYRVRKFIKRNAIPVSIAGLFTAVIMLLITLYTGWLQQERHRAALEAERAVQITEILSRSLPAVDPFQNPGIDITAEMLLDNSLAYINKELGDDREMQAHLGGILADMYVNLGMHHTGDSLSAASFSTFTEMADTTGTEYIKKLVQRSGVLLKTGQFEASGQYIEKAVRLADQHLEPGSVEYADVYYQYNNYLYETGSYEQSDAILHRLLPVYERNREEEPEKYLDVLFFLVTNYRKMGIYDSAEVYLTKALERTRSRYDTPDEKIDSTLNHLSSLYQDMGRYNAALPFARESYRQRRQIFGEEHINTFASQANMARVLNGANRLEESANTYQSLISRFEKQYPGNYNLVGLIQSYAGVLMKMKEFEQAEKHLQRAIKLGEQLLPGDHLRRSYPLETMARLYKMQQDYSEALKYAREAKSIREQVLADDNPLLASSRYTLGICQWYLGQREEAEKNLKQALTVFERTPEKYKEQIATIDELGL